MPAAPLVPVRAELFPVRGCGTGWTGRRVGWRSWLVEAFLLAGILDLLAGNRPAPPPTGPRPPLEPLSDREIRVLRYLPTHLSTPEIASELSVSPNTVKTHMRNLYAKLGAHRRTEAVESARALGLLAPSAPQR